jgi:hypothetical protein
VVIWIFAPGTHNLLFYPVMSPCGLQIQPVAGVACFIVFRGPNGSSRLLAN